MIKGERLFAEGQIFSHDQVQLTPERAAPFLWCQHPLIQNALDHNLSDMKSEIPSQLEASHLPLLMPRLLSQPEVFQPTVEALFPYQQPEISSIQGLHLQAGIKAFILLGQARTKSDESKSFVIYLSRGPEGTVLEDQTEEDFHNLKELNAVAQARLVDQARQKYQFIDPLALDLSPEFNGARYPFFTMPFVNGYGELRAEICEEGSLGTSIPFFRFALPSNQAMKDYDRRVAREVLQIVADLERRQKRTPQRSIVEISDSVKNSTLGRKFLAKTEDVLVGNALIFLLSEGHFPREFQVNSGDWLMKPMRDRFYLYLTTVRGGWEYLGSDERWIERMKDHHEPVPHREHYSFALFHGHEDLIVKNLERAKKFVR